MPASVVRRVDGSHAMRRPERGKGGVYLADTGDDGRPKAQARATMGGTSSVRHAAKSVPSVVYDPARLESVAQALGLRLVVLFGSYATGHPPPGPESDLDIAVLDRELPTWERWRVVYGALAEVFDGYDVDLAFLNTADPLFRYEVMRSGRRLYGDPVEFWAYRAFAFRDYQDSADLRSLEHVLFIKKMNYIRACLYGP